MGMMSLREKVEQMMTHFLPQIGSAQACQNCMSTRLPSRKISLFQTGAVRHGGTWLPFICLLIYLVAEVCRHCIHFANCNFIELEPSSSGSFAATAKDTCSCPPAGTKAKYTPIEEPHPMIRARRGCVHGRLLWEMVP